MFKLSDVFLLWDRFKDWRNPVRTLPQRFVKLFGEHGVTRTQIPRFLGEEWGWSQTDVRSDESLLVKLEERLLAHVCELFGIRRQWLDGEDVAVYPSLHFYKDLVKFDRFATGLSPGNAELFVLKPNDCDLSEKTGNRNDDLALVFRVEIAAIGDKIIYKYLPLTENYPWGHKPARLYLKAMGLICWRRNIHFQCRNLPMSRIRDVMSGGIFLNSLIEDELYSGMWYLDDFIFLPSESAVGTDEAEVNESRELLRDHGLGKLTIGGVSGSSA